MSSILNAGDINLGKPATELGAEGAGTSALVNAEAKGRVGDATAPSMAANPNAPTVGGATTGRDTLPGAGSGDNVSTSGTGNAPGMPSGGTHPPHTHQFVCSTLHHHHDVVNPTTGQPYGVATAPGQFFSGILNSVAVVKSGPDPQQATSSETSQMNMPVPEPFPANPGAASGSTDAGEGPHTAGIDRNQAGPIVGHGTDVQQWPGREGVYVGGQAKSATGVPALMPTPQVPPHAQQPVAREAATGGQGSGATAVPASTSTSGGVLPSQGPERHTHHLPGGTHEACEECKRTRAPHDAPRQDNGEARSDSHKPKPTPGKKTWTTEGPSHMHLRPGESFTEKETRVHTGLESGETKLTITGSRGTREEKSTYNLRPGETITEEVETLHHRDGKPTATSSPTKGSRRMSLGGKRKSAVAGGAAAAAGVSAGAVGMGGQDTYTQSPSSATGEPATTDTAATSREAGSTSVGTTGSPGVHRKPTITDRIFGRAGKMAGRATRNEALVSEGQQTASGEIGAVRRN